MNHLEELHNKAHEAMREARIAYMVKVMFDCEMHYCEKPEPILRSSRRAFPLLAGEAEEAEDYGRALGRLRAYCYKNNLY